MKKKSNPNFMNGVPELLILTLLSREEMYGYELVKAIRLATGDSISLGEGVVYPALHSLQKQGFLDVKKEKVNGRNRVYYRANAEGGKRLKKLRKDWMSITDAVIIALDGKLSTTAGEQ